VGKMDFGMGAKTRWQLKLHIFSMEEEYQSSWRVNEGTCKLQLNGKNIKIWPYKKRLKS